MLQKAYHATLGAVGNAFHSCFTFHWPQQDPERSFLDAKLATSKAFDDDSLLMQLQPVPAALQQMPVFVGHGDLDPLVPVQLARQTAQGLKTAGEAAGILPVPVPSFQAARY